MRYTQVPADTFESIQLNAGIIVDGFTPATGAIENIIGATTGGFTFTATPTYSDFGEDIDNVPRNTKELKKLDYWEATASGTFVTVSTSIAKNLLGAADVSSTKVTPRNDVKIADFDDIWWVGDYSNINDSSNGGFCAIHIINGLSTNGFQLKSTDKGKGNFAFNYMAHYSISDPDSVPFEIYIKPGTT